jgi:hypothetical protein
MPQIATTVAAFVERVEELTAVEISFEDHEFYAAGKLIASIGHDDDLTQPWVVMVNGESVHRENTWAKCYRYICTHYKDGSLPVQEQFYPASTTGNEVMVEIAAECEKYGFEILDDGIYSNDQKLGSISCTDGHWWFIRATSGHQQKVLDAVWVLSMVELLLQGSEELLDKPFDELTPQEWERLREYQPVVERELVAA